MTVLSAMRKVAPPPQPETFGAHSKQSGESPGVIAMINLPCFLILKAARKAGLELVLLVHDCLRGARHRYWWFRR